MNSRGQILEMKLPKELMDSLNKVAGGGQMGGFLSEEGLKEMGQMGLLPEKAVHPGDTWSREAAVMGMKVEATYRYIGTEVRNGKELDKIGMAMKMQFGGEKEAKMKVKNQQSDGSMYFDNEAGRFVSGKNKMKMTMEIPVSNQTLEMDMEITQEWKVKPEGTPKK
jgi:hypothetical protein